MSIFTVIAKEARTILSLIIMAASLAFLFNNDTGVYSWASETQTAKIKAAEAKARAEAAARQHKQKPPPHKAPPAPPPVPTKAFNITKYGAISGQDSTAAITKAAAAAKAAGSGAYVYVPPGSFPCQTLTFNGVSVSGTGDMSILQFQTGNTSLTLTGNSPSLSNLYVQGVNAGTGSTAIVNVQSANNFTISQVKISAGELDINGSASGEVTGCTFTICNMDVHVGSSTNINFDAHNGANKFYLSPGLAAVVVDVGSQNVNFEGNIFYGGFFGTGVNHLMLHNNQFITEAITSYSVALVAGTGGGNYGGKENVNFGPVSNVTISNNAFRNTGHLTNAVYSGPLGLGTSNYSGSIDAVNITGNTYDATGCQTCNVGFSCDQTSNLTISNNVITNLQGAGSTWGLDAVECPNLTITANTISNTKTGPQMVLMPSATGYTHITNNVMSNDQDSPVVSVLPISTTAFPPVVITGNSYKETGKTPSAGLFIDCLQPHADGKNPNVTASNNTAPPLRPSFFAQ